MLDLGVRIKLGGSAKLDPLAFLGRESPHSDLLYSAVGRDPFPCLLICKLRGKVDAVEILKPVVDTESVNIDNLRLASEITEIVILGIQGAEKSAAVALWVPNAVFDF